MTTFFQDLRYGLRMLGKNPGFTVVAVLTLALGIGANTAIFSVVNGLFLHPQGIPDPNQLVALRVKYDKLGLKNINVSVPDFAQVRDDKDFFSSAAIESTSDFNYAAGEWPQRLLGAQVTWQWFDVFHARPMLGRTFTAEEDQPNANHEVVLAYSAWKQWFGGDAGVIGRSIQLNEQSYRVIGVMGPSFQVPGQVALWVPLALAADEYAPGNTFNESYFAVARLRPNVSLAQASAAVVLLTERVVDNPAASYAQKAGWGMFIMPLVEFVYGDVRTPLLILAGAVGFVLLIACANIAGLLLAKAASRSREFALRAALGAAHWRLIRQVLAESFLLAACGAAVGVLAANASIAALMLIVPKDLMPGAAFPLDSRVLLFTLGVTILSAVMFGVAPALHASHADPYEALKEGGRSATGGKAHQRLRSAMVVGEVALALVLLAGTGLLLRSLSSLSEVSPGFQPNGVMTGALALPKVKYDTPEKQMDFFRSVLERLSSAPGVTMAAAGVPLPFSGSNWSASFSIEGRPTAPGSPGPHGDVRYVTPGFFKTLEIPVLRGRTFTSDDRKGTPLVAVIDENLARQYWPHQDPIGQKIGRGRPGEWAVIVGIVGHIRFNSLAGEEIGGGVVQSGTKGAYYFSMYQTPPPYGFLIARTSGDPSALSATFRGAVRDVDPDQPIHDFQTMDERVWSSLGPQRFATTLLGIFAGLAILLAAVGLYGVVSYGVANRTHEFGIRIALGARAPEIARMVLVDALKLAIPGAALGVAAALAFTRLMRSLLFGVGSADPLTFLAVALFLIIVALLASYIPARRATKVDPMVALRYE
jgi:putative ABC transport system permease protein